MKYLLKSSLGATSECTLESLESDFSAGKLTGALVSHPDVGTWAPVSEFLADLHSVQNPPSVITPTTRCFVITNGDRRGPFVQEQLRSMYMSGAITADATVTWEGCALPRPIASVVGSQVPPIGAGFSKSSSDTTSARSTSNWRVGLTLVGGIVGLLVSYLMRPTFLGIGPSPREWFLEGFNSPYASTLYTCAGVGLVCGYVTGHIVGSNQNKK